MFLLNQIRHTPANDDEAETQLLHEFEILDSDTPATTTPEEEEHPRYKGGEAALADAAWQWKAIALITALMLPVGSHFSTTALGAMKSSIKDNLNIDNTRYGVLASSVTLINTVFPILGGYAMDRFGSVRSTLAVNALILCGSLLTAVAADRGSFPLMVLSRIIFGIGSGLVVTMQESLLSKWFQTSSLASLVIGLQLMTSRLASFVGMLVANLVAERTGNWVWPLWLAFLLCMFSIVMNGVYALVVIHVIPSAASSTTTTTTTTAFSSRPANAHRRDHPSLLAAVLRFPVLYWSILAIEFLYSAVWSSFITISTELVQLRPEKTSSSLAGFQASAALIVPVIGSPLVGMIMDNFGHRVSMLLFSNIFLIASTVLLGWVPAVHAVVGMLLFSFSITLGPIAMITSIGILLPSASIGVGLGLYKSANNIGSTLLDILVGVIQDQTEHQSYSGVMALYLILGCIGLIFIGLLFGAQRIYLNNLLQVGKEDRVAVMRAKHAWELKCLQQGGTDDEDVYYVGNDDAAAASSHVAINKRTNYVFVGVFMGALLTAWILFFVSAAALGSSGGEQQELTNKQDSS